MARHPDVPLWVWVGDVASNDGDYFDAGRAALLDQGQQRRLRRDRRGDRGTIARADLHYLRNGGRITVGPWRVAALGGTFAPSWYHTPASLPPARGDKRRHFVRDEAEAWQEPRRQAPALRDEELACKALTASRSSDARGAAAVLSGRRRIDAGRPGSTTCWRRCARGCTCSATITSSPTRCDDRV